MEIENVINLMEEKIYFVEKGKKKLEIDDVRYWIRLLNDIRAQGRVVHVHHYDDSQSFSLGALMY